MTSRIKKSLLILFMIFFSSVVSAKPYGINGKGHVAMRGSIIDTACAIDLDDRYQEIDVEVTSFSQISHGEFLRKPFHIHLVNCTSDTVETGHHWSKFSITFDSLDGVPTHDNIFPASGEAKGIGIRIHSTDGETAIPGIPMTPRGLVTGKMDLGYVFELVADPGEKIQVGNISTTVRFRVDYN